MGMKMILSGGGGYAKNPAAYDLFFGAVDKSRPLLYIPLANDPATFVNSYPKFAAFVMEHGVLSTRLCDSVKMFSEFELSEFGGIYCEGGNTFRLLKLLKESGADEKIKRYLKNGGVYLGSSAGAIIGGKDIYPIIFMDANAVLLDDTSGLDMMRGYSSIAHYGDAATDFKNREWYDATEKLAGRYDKLIALSEESAIVIEDGGAYILGAECKVYENGVPRMIPGGDKLF